MFDIEPWAYLPDARRPHAPLPVRGTSAGSSSSRPIVRQQDAYDGSCDFTGLSRFVDVEHQATASVFAPYDGRVLARWQSTSARVLVIDERIVAEPLARYLTSEGFDAHAAVCAVEAVAFCGQQLPAAVLVEARMLGEEELCFLRLARGRWPRLPVVVMTASDSPETRLLAMELNAAAFLTKPFDDLRVLLQLLSHVAAAPCSRW